MSDPSPTAAPPLLVSPSVVAPFGTPPDETLLALPDMDEGPAVNDAVPPTVPAVLTEELPASVVLPLVSELLDPEALVAATVDAPLSVLDVVPLVTVLAVTSEPLPLPSAHGTVSGSAGPGWSSPRNGMT